MNADCIKLTSYFGERHRVNGTSAADALVDLYGRNDIAASIVLRGIQGLGLKHHLRTDSSPSLCHDPPMTAIAVDTRPNIEALLDQTLKLNLPGVVTLGQARLLTGEIGSPGIAETAGESTRLTVYFGRRDRVYGVPAFEAICELLYRRDTGGATALLGVDGSAHGYRRQARLLGRNVDLPVMVVAVGAGNRIGMVLPELTGLLRHPLITLEQVRICKLSGQLINVPELTAEAHDRDFPLWHKLTVFISEAARHDRQPTHRALVRGLRSAGVGVALTHRGFWGFHGDRPPHGDRFLQHDRHAPTITTVIVGAERVFAAFDIIDKFTTERGLVTSQAIPGMRLN